MKYQVLPAEPAGSGTLCSIGRASYMLIKQYNFPDFYTDQDRLDHFYSDRLETENSYKERVNKHFRDGYPYMHPQIESSTDAAVLAALIDICEADKETTWTGYRVTATVTLLGWTVYTMELFAKHPESSTEVYSGNTAPNILSGLRYS